MSKIKVGLVSLGCDKNRIDSEIILNNLSTDGNFQIVSNPKIADVIIVNTCGFIESAKQESIDTILEMSGYKKNYSCKALVVTGCLSQRYREELAEALPEIDIMLGVNDYGMLTRSILDFLNKSDLSYKFCNYSDSNINTGGRILTTLPHTAYLRIAEGCDNFCTYCIIPKIRGKYRSRKFESILEEAAILAEQGVKEIILVAQDTTRYGIDLYNKKRLHEVIEAISGIEGIKWIRVLYCYPEEIYDELISVMAANNKVCKYLDIPLQHISDNILKRMGRRGRKKELVQIIGKLRENIENLCLRTSIIVGFPGETEEDFSELRDFIASTKFDNLGVFKYSQEEDTPAAIMKGQIDEDVKETRYNELMGLQQEISKEKNRSKTGRIYEVIIDGHERGRWTARSYEMSPDIDGVVYIESKYNLEIGSMIKVKITGSMEYDLIGVVYYESR
ncbi:MAG: 30S ribosomal protein S12 methylthiotransferase RimO [Clostridiaceae bacterium]